MLYHDATGLVAGGQPYVDVMDAIHHYATFNRIRLGLGYQAEDAADGPSAPRPKPPIPEPRTLGE